MRNPLVLFSVGVALLYWLWRAPLPYNVIMKWLAIISLATFVWQQRQSWQETLLVVALGCHSVGDVLLDWDRTKLFLPAVGAFMVGHVLYLVTFWPNLMTLASLPPAKKVLAATVLLYGLAMAFLIVPHLPKKLFVAVAVYMIVILAMTLVVTCTNYRNPWLILGAVLYVISDSLIALNTFVRPLGMVAQLIWPLYYAGQLLIAHGFLHRHAPAEALAIS